MIQAIPKNIHIFRNETWKPPVFEGVSPNLTVFLSTVSRAEYLKKLKIIPNNPKMVYNYHVLVIDTQVYLNEKEFQEWVLQDYVPTIDRIVKQSDLSSPEVKVHVIWDCLDSLEFNMQNMTLKDYTSNPYRKILGRRIQILSQHVNLRYSSSKPQEHPQIANCYKYLTFQSVPIDILLKNSSRRSPAPADMWDRIKKYITNMHALRNVVNDYPEHEEDRYEHTKIGGNLLMPDIYYRVYKAFTGMPDILQIKINNLKTGLAKTSEITTTNEFVTDEQDSARVQFFNEVCENLNEALTTEVLPGMLVKDMSHVHRTIERINLSTPLKYVPIQRSDIEDFLKRLKESWTATFTPTNIVGIDIRHISLRTVQELIDLAKNDDQKINDIISQQPEQ